MKAVTSIFFFGISLTSSLAAQAPKPSKKIDLDRIKIHGQVCENRWGDGYSQVLWVDDQHLATFLLASCLDGAALRQPSGQVIVFDGTGSVEAAAQRDGLISVFRGPRGTIAGLSWGKVELLDSRLGLKQSLDCPGESQSCGIILAPSPTSDSEFALCSTVKTQRVCEFYEGWPAKKIPPEATAVCASKNPYKDVADIGHTSWQVGGGETWFFDNGRLTRAGVGNPVSLVSSEDFVGKNGGNCDGELSTSEPHRFLAVCAGAHWYSDGMFDSIFGFSRVVLFDAPSGHQVMRIDRPAFTSAALSPSGKRVATLRGNKVRIYESQ
jgi:hypothetical protein